MDGKGIEELLRVAEPPLRYLATARPRRLAPNALPTARILELIDGALGTGGGDRSALDELRAVFADFPIDDAAGRQASARRGLEALARLRDTKAVSATPAETAPAPPRGADSSYRQTIGGVAPALELLSSSVQFLKGVGPKRAEMLGRLGIRTFEDLLFHLPFRYEDRRALTPIGQAVPGTEVTVVGSIVAIGAVRAGRSRRRVLEAKLGDESGILTLVWFHQTGYFAERLKAGAHVIAHGRVEAGYGRRRIIHPEIEVLEEGEEATPGIVSIYEKPTEMSVGAMRKLVAAAYADAGERVPSVLPAAAARHAVLDLATALREVHEPDARADVEALNRGTTAAHRAVVFDELFFLELGMLLRKHSVAEEPGISFRPDGALALRLRERLPFRLTGAQERVLEEIAGDMAAPHPMNRLVQGDVGSGKTVVAVLAALGAIECGYQAALMAPTEILAEQHYQTLGRWLLPLGVRVELLTGKVQGRDRQAVYAALATGAAALLVGTHAIIQESVSFRRLGLGIIDEQHRFGVLQRKALKGLGENPDILLMTATPIPRTLAMTLYGDLDLSFLDEMPPGRQPIVTQVVRERERPRVWSEVRRELEQGRQAYLVFPLVEDSEATDLRSAKKMAEELATGPFQGFRLALLHGQMKSEEKDAVMRRFQAGDHQCLVATTVIEVGIDVPNATVMVVDHAEQFGLAQLHQLRGRVGRGAERSFCYLVSTGRAGLEGYKRLKLLERETNGGRIAEADLDLRGPGELMGLRQSGLPDFRVANLVRDARLLEVARREADAVLRADPGLRSPELQSLRQVLDHRWQGRLGLARVG